MMSIGELLFEGPRDLFLSIALQFLTLDELARLDSAVCSSQRPSYLNALSSREAVVENIRIGGRIVQPGAAVLEWLRRRQLGVRQLGVKADRASGCFRYLSHSLSRPLEGLSIERASTTQLAKLLPHCPALLQLTIKGCGEGGNKHIQPLSACPKLHFLTLSHLDVVRSAHLKGLVQAYACLRVESCSNFSKRAVLDLHLPHLRDLSLHSVCAMKDSRLTRLLLGCPRLEVLSIRGCGGVSQKGLCGVGVVGSLLTLHLWGVTDAVVDSIVGGCRRLQHIDLHHSPLTDQSMRRILSSCRHLQTLSFTACGIVGEGEVRVGYTGDRPLTSLTFNSCLALQGVMNVCEQFPRLAHLALDDCIAARHTACTEAFRHGKSLKYFCLTGSPHIYGYDLEAITEPLPLMQRVVVDNCSHFSDEGAISLALLCPHLTHLSMQHCDVRLQAFAPYLARMEDLDITGAHVCSPAGLAALLQCLGLHSLGVSIEGEGGEGGADLLEQIALSSPQHLRLLRLDFLDFVHVQALVRMLDALGNLVTIQVGQSSINFAQYGVFLLKRLYPGVEINVCSVAALEV
ncbi:hypothetical protein B484DRAFT_477746 [Ochromonadaceae sp. CCMP2298]|nr:hypothetical protein B484DRAFT_477746 [Ochromonadaceae sp. CCMP2298]